MGKLPSELWDLILLSTVGVNLYQSQTASARLAGNKTVLKWQGESLQCRSSFKG